MMTRSLIVGLVSVSILDAAGQTPYTERLDQSYPVVQYVGGLSLDSSFAVLSWSDPGYTPFIFRRLDFYSSTGEFLNSVGVSTGFSDWKGVLVRSADGGAWMAGALDGCDVFFTGRILRFGPDGTMLLDRTYEFDELSSNIYEVSRIAQNASDRIALFGNGVAIADTLGNILEYWNPPGGQIYGPSSWYADSLLITSGFSIMHIRGAGGVPLYTRNLSASISDMQVIDDHIWILSNDTLFHLGQDLAEIGAFPLPVSTWPEQFVKGGGGALLQLGDALYAYGPGQGITPVLTPSLVEGQVVRAFVRVDTLVLTVGVQHVNSYSTGLPQPYAGGVIRAYALDGTTSVHDEDVEVEAVVLDSLWINYSTQSQFAYVYGDLTIEVRNSGTGTLQDFGLAFRNGVLNVTCGIPTEYMTISGAVIAPGGTATYTMTNRLLWLGQASPGDVIESDVCVTALGPNGLMDRFLGNNTSCTPMQVTVGVSVGTNELLSSARVYPSPFTDQFVIDITAHGTSYLRVHDVTGALVLERTLSGPGPHVVPANGLRSGMYMLTLDADQVTSHFKLLRE